MNVGERIRYFREKAGLSNRQLALKAGLSQPVMYRLENNERNADIETLEKICNALGITLKDFFDEGLSAEPLPKEYKQLVENAKSLTPEQLRQLNEFLKTLKK